MGDLKKLNKNAVRGLSNISLHSFEEGCNKYITEGISVGKCELGELHRRTRDNIEKGIVELLSNNNIDYSSVRGIFNIATWKSYISFDYEIIGVYEDFGNYYLDFTKRKNASMSNDTVTLNSIPRFEIDKNIKDNVGVDNSVYDMLMFFVKGNAMQCVDYYEQENKELENTIQNNKKLILDYKKILNNFEENV